MTCDSREEIFSLLVLPKDAAQPQGAMMLGGAWEKWRNPEDEPPSWTVYISVPEESEGEAAALREDIPAVMRSYASREPSGLGYQEIGSNP